MRLSNWPHSPLANIPLLQNVDDLVQHLLTPEHNNAAEIAIIALLVDPRILDAHQVPIDDRLLVNNDIAAQRPQDRVRSASVPLESGTLRQNIRIRESANDRQDLVARAARLDQLELIRDQFIFNHLRFAATHADYVVACVQQLAERGVIRRIVTDAPHTLSLPPETLIALSKTHARLGPSLTCM